MFLQIKIEMLNENLNVLNMPKLVIQIDMPKVRPALVIKVHINTQGRVNSITHKGLFFAFLF